VCVCVCVCVVSTRMRYDIFNKFLFYSEYWTAAFGEK